MLVVRDISKSFPGVQALADINIALRSGEVHALIGENGAGKSTLVKILGGAHRPDSGQVLLHDRPLPLGDPVAMRRAGIGIVYQELTLVPELTVAQNIYLGREPASGPWLKRAEMVRSAGRWLERLGCRCRPDTRVRELGVGTCQMIEVARGLTLDAKVLVFDEPSATLSESELAELFKVIRELRAKGMAIVYISHRLDEIFELADRVTVLRDGRHIVTQDMEGVDRPQLIRWMVGRDLAEEYPARAPQFGDVVLDVNRLAAKPYFSDASFQLRRGELLGVAGLVGAGRTSMGLCLFGALKPTGGTVQLDGQLIRSKSPEHALADGIGYLTEDRKGRGLFGGLSVGENIVISHLKPFKRAGFLARSAMDQAADDAVRQFDIRTPDTTRAIRVLSGGNQQKALLARLLQHNLKVLILDEPTRGVDVGARAEIYSIINRLAADGVGIIMISSELPELLGTCDRIMVMCEGRRTGTLDVRDATQEKIMHLASPEKTTTEAA